MNVAVIILRLLESSHTSRAAPNPSHNLRAVDKMARVWQRSCCSTAICTTLQILMLLCSHVTAQDSCVVSPWEDVINRDLSVFKTTTLHPGLIEQGKKQCYGGWEVMIYDNQLYAIPFGKVPRSTRPPAIDLLAKALCRYKFPNVRFILNAYERKRYADTRDAAVVFSSSKDPNSDVDILLPHHSFVYMPSMRNDLAGNLQFEQRMDQAIWRGAATGGPYNNFTWRHTTRSRAVAACRERQDICDAGTHSCTLRLIFNLQAPGINALEALLSPSGTAACHRHRHQ